MQQLEVFESKLRRQDGIPEDGALFAKAESRYNGKRNSHAKGDGRYGIKAIERPMNMERAMERRIGKAREREPGRN